MSYRLHKFVLALCVTLCLALSLWPRPLGPARVGQAPSGAVEPSPETVETHEGSPARNGEALEQARERGRLEGAARRRADSRGTNGS